MPDTDRHETESRLGTASRRAFLAGGAAVGLAGCVGSQIGSPGGSGGGTVRIASFPLDVDGVVFEYIDSSGLLQEKLDPLGWDYEMKLTFQDIPLYVSGKADIGGFSELEAARLGAERGMNTVMFARRANAYLGMLVKSGSEMDPANTGSVEATVEKVAAEGKVGIGGWGLGSIPNHKIVLKEAYGLTFSEEGGDFSVVTADMPSLAQLLEKGEVDMIDNSPAHGSSGLMLDGTIKPVYWGHDKMKELGFALPPLAGMTTRKDFYEQNTEVAKAVFEAANEGYTWFFENGLDEIPPKEKWRKKLGTSNKKQARYTVRWEQHDQDVKYATKFPPRPKDIGYDKSQIVETRDFLKRVEEAGFIPGGWQGHIEWKVL